MSEGERSEEVQVVYSAADLRAITLACRRCRWIMVLSMLAPPAVVFYLSWNDLPRDLWPILVGSLLAIGIVLAAFLIISPTQMVRRRRAAGWGSPMEISFSPLSVNVRHPSQDSQNHWSAIMKVREKGGRLFLFTTPNNAIILPRRAFASDEQFSEWCRRAAAYQQAARRAEA
ncbi:MULTISPECIES: YcxB family protein [Sphingomonas]|uniref:YcxB family protein n=1 Tax=Sphingomonas TaxID=13687 RepID=UPI001269EFF0|nr:MULTISPECIES: YcxB family protein [Sphingomonas]